MNDTVILSAMGVVIVAIIGAVWGMLRNKNADIKREMSDLKKELAELKKDFNQLRTDHARSEERDKSFEGVMSHVASSFDRLGEKIDRLARLVETGIRSTTPSPRSYHGGPLIPREEKDR